MTIVAGGTLIPTKNGVDPQTQSFETWQPNREHTLTFNFPLSDVDATKEIPIRLELTGATIKPLIYSDYWLGTDWRSNKKVTP